MSVTLDATVGGSASNSLQTADGVQAILDGVRNTVAWDALDDDDKDVVCVEATTQLSAYGYRGQKVNYAQALPFPRSGLKDPDFGETQDLSSAGPSGWGVFLDSTTIPRRMLRGHAMLCLEIARAGTSDVWGVDDSLDVKRKRVDIIDTEYADHRFRRIGLRKYPSVWREIAPLTTATAERTLERA